MVCLHDLPQSPSFCHMELHNAWRLFPRFNRQHQTNLEPQAETEWHWTDSVLPLFLSSFCCSMASFVIASFSLWYLCLLCLNMNWFRSEMKIDWLSLPLSVIVLRACCGLNSRSLSSQRVPSLCLAVLFERLIFSSIRTKLSRAKVFGIVRLTHIKKVENTSKTSFIHDLISSLACAHEHIAEPAHSVETHSVTHAIFTLDPVTGHTLTVLTDDRVAMYNQYCIYCYQHTKRNAHT